MSVLGRFIISSRRHDDVLGHYRLGESHVRFTPNSVAKLFSGCRIVIIESLYQMKRIILTEIGTATNQCYAKFPWTEFCNRIGGKADIVLKSRDVRLYEALSVKAVLIQLS